MMRLPNLPTLPSLAALAACSLASSALAQEAMYTNAATMPSPGVSVIREQVHYYRYGGNPNTGADHTDQLEFLTSWQLGLDRALSLTLDVPIEFRNTVDNDTDDRDKGVEDIDLMLKYRIYQDDSGGIDTFRIALMGGVSFASGDDHDFSTGSVNPAIGGVVTKVWGRHGFNQDVIYRFNTGGDFASNMGGDGPDDALKFDTAYLFRIAPTEYTEHTTGAWYATAEINGLYETGGDTELRFSPGFMYEGREFVFQIMTQFPLWHDLKDRGELDVAIGIGVRLLF